MLYEGLWMNQISLSGDIQGVAQEEMFCPLVINFFSCVSVWNNVYSWWKMLKYNLSVNAVPL